MKKEIKEKISENWEIRFCNIWGDCKFDIGKLKKSCNFIRQEKQKLTEEIERELIKVLRISKTADEYHIGIAYVIDILKFVKKN